MSRRARGATVIYTTHYMEEAQELCDRIAIIDHGKLLAVGTLDELRRRVGEKDLVRLAGRFDPPATTRALDALDEVEVLLVAADGVTIAAAGASRKLPAIFAALASAGADISGDHVERAQPGKPVHHADWPRAARISAVHPRRGVEGHAAAAR